MSRHDLTPGGQRDKRAQAATRTRRWRQRKRDGAVLIGLRISAEGIADLARLGWLAPERLADPNAVAGAVLGICGEAATSGLRPRK
jgi:hypothetical protein